MADIAPQTAQGQMTLDNLTEQVDQSDRPAVMGSEATHDEYADGYEQEPTDGAAASAEGSFVTENGIVIELGSDFKPEMDHVDIGEMDDGDAELDAIDGIDRGVLTSQDIVVGITPEEMDEMLATETRFYRRARQRLSKLSVAPETLIKSETLHAYFKEISRINLLTAAEEVDLSKRYQAGVAMELAMETEDNLPRDERRRMVRLIDMGIEAKHQMIASNLRLVVSIAKRYQNQKMPLIDLIQSGNTGLIRAVEKFDYTKGFKFSTYATWWIRQSVTRAIADQSRTIRIPVHLIESINKMKKVRQELSQELNREPTIEELADAMGTTVEKVEGMIRNMNDASSLDTPVGEDEGASLGDLIEDEGVEHPLASVDNSALHEKLMEIAADLDEREYRIIMCRYGLDGTPPMTLEAIGNEMGVTRERIRQIESKALAKLRHPSHSKGLIDFMFMLSDEAKE